MLAMRPGVRCASAALKHSGPNKWLTPVRFTRNSTISRRKTLSPRWRRTCARMRAWSLSRAVTVWASTSTRPLTARWTMLSFPTTECKRHQLAQGLSPPPSPAPNPSSVPTSPNSSKIFSKRCRSSPKCTLRRKPPRSSSSS